jgi:cytochrome P450
MGNHAYVQARGCSVGASGRDSLQNPRLTPDITVVDIDGYYYLQAVYSEVFQLWPLISLTLRNAARDTSINGGFVLKGTTIVLPPWVLNTSRDLWSDDASEFRPERWLCVDGKANNSGGVDSSYMTFLHGPHSYIGRHFSRAELACLIAIWVGQFETEFEEGSLCRRCL